MTNINEYRKRREINALARAYVQAGFRCAQQRPPLEAVAHLVVEAEQAGLEICAIPVMETAANMLFMSWHFGSSKEQLHKLAVGVLDAMEQSSKDPDKTSASFTAVVDAWLDVVDGSCIIADFAELTGVALAGAVIHGEIADVPKQRAIVQRFIERFLDLLPTDEEAPVTTDPEET